MQKLFNGDILKALKVVALCGLVTIAVVACDDDDEDVIYGMGPGAFASDYATNNNFFTKMTSAQAGTSPHGTVRIWYSTNVRGLIDGSNFVVPIGTVAIKEFDNDGTPGVDGTVVMIKQDSTYDPSYGNWYYEMRDTSGSILNSGAIDMCKTCHVGASATDYLAGTKLSN